MDGTVIRTPMARCRLGVGQVDITPPADTYHRNWGAALHDRAAGIHRPLLASALVLSSDQALSSDRTCADDPGECVLVALDLGWLRAREMNALLSKLEATMGVAPGHLVLTFSHTHAAANLDLEREGEPGTEHIRPYLDALPGKILDAYRAAKDALAPVDLSLAAGHCALAMQRDYWDEGSGQYVCGPNPGAEADSTVMVVRATDTSGRPVAHLVNYACHPTTLAWANDLISPDYIGAMRQTVEASTGCPCVFLQGASGDLGPRHGFVGDPEVADANGRQLAHAALSALAGLSPPGTEMRYSGPVISGATLGVWEHVQVDAARREQLGVFQTAELRLDLPLRELPSPAELDRQLEQWRDREQQARDRDDAKAVRDCRAQVERVRRTMRRREELPPSGRADYRIRLWRLGEAVLVLLGGEPYSLLQSALRSRFPGTPILIAELCNQSHSYILPRDQFGKGLYQDGVATLAPGALEAIIAAIADQLDAWDLP